MGSSEDLKLIQDELKWIAGKEKQALGDRITSRGVFGVLVPMGCLVTAGVLSSGLYHLYKKNSQKQQRFMRYRVLAQGVTIVLAAIGVFQLKP